MEDYRDALETMAVAPLRLVQLVAPAMRKRKFGRIVFVSSAAPLRGIANYAPYVSARTAANGLVASLAKELGRDGITVNAVGSNYVRPDYFPTGAARQQGRHGQDDGADFARPARPSRRTSWARPSAFSVRKAQASSRAICCPTPADGRDATLTACNNSRTTKAAHVGRRGRQGSE